MKRDNLMPILGIGNDIVEIERIKKSLEEHGSRMLLRLFTKKEQEYCLKYKDSAPHFCGRFSAKESISKALGTGIGKELSWLDMEILNEESGKPYVCFSEELKQKLGNTQVLISISHSQLYVSSFAIWIQNTEKGSE